MRRIVINQEVIITNKNKNKTFQINAPCIKIQTLNGQNVDSIQKGRTTTRNKRMPSTRTKQNPEPRVIVEEVPLKGVTRI